MGLFYESASLSLRNHVIEKLGTHTQTCMQCRFTDYVVLARCSNYMRLFNPPISISHHVDCKPWSTV